MESQVVGFYSKQLSSIDPGLILILIDQSQSMKDDYGEQTKDKVAADVVNRVIYEIRKANQSGSEYKDRCYVGVIGYGETVEPLVGGMVSELSENILETRATTETVSDGMGGEVQIDLNMPLWVLPKATNGTPMDYAFQQAANLVAQWTSQHPTSFPPIVINITDGIPNDLQRGGDGQKTVEAAKKLMELGTDDGRVLLFNAHVAQAGVDEILLPSDQAKLTNTYARYLFNITSSIPATLFKVAQEVGFEPKNGARGMVFNAGAESLIKLLNFGSSSFR